MMRLIRIIILLLAACSVATADQFRLDNDTDIEDSFLRSWAGGDDNFGTEDHDFIYNLSSNDQRFIIKALSAVWDSIGEGATITFAACSLYTNNADADANPLYAYGVWKTWMVGTCTWLDWDATANEWGTAGCNSTNDGGSFNNTDNGGDDRMATASDSDVPSSAAWFGYVITDWAQTCYDADSALSVIFAYNAGEASNGTYVYTRDAGSFEPFFVFEYYISDHEDLYPDGVSSPDNWANYGGANKVSSVSDGVDDNYIFEDTDGQQQNFTMANPTIISGDDTIDSVKIMWRGRDNGAGANGAQMEQWVGLSHNDGRNTGLTTSWTDYDDNFALAPDGGAWTLSDLNSLILRARCTEVAALVEVWVTKLYARAYYTPADGGGWQGQVIPIGGD